MSYLSVRNFWKYQNADVWKKSLGHPPWFKFFVHRDYEIDHLPLEARLLWYELLSCASRNLNAMRSDPEWLSSETRIPCGKIAEMLPLLVKGGWLRETKTPRRSRKILESFSENSRPNREEKRREEEPSAVKQASVVDGHDREQRPDFTTPNLRSMT